MWRELIGRLYRDAEFAAPATDADIDRIERRLGQKVPDELRKVLRETVGARGEYGSELVWPVREIVDQNTEFRQNTDITELYKPFDQLMFVGDNGGGDQFAYLLAAGERSGGVFAWDHETDERIWIADCCVPEKAGRPLALCRAGGRSLLTPESRVSCSPKERLIVIIDPSALQKSIQDKLDFLAALAPLAGAGNQTAEEQSRQTVQALIPESAQAVALKCKAMAELFEMLGATAPSDYTKLSEDQLTGAFEFVSTVGQSLQKLEAEVERSRERFPF